MKQSVVSIIFNSDKSSVLLTKRRDVPVWVLPGGGIEEGEQPEEAALREVAEETSMQVVIERKTGEYFPINKLAKVTHLFECRTVGGIPAPSNETCEVAFFPIATAQNLLFIIHREWLEDALRCEPDLIKRPITSVTYFELCKYFLRHPWHVLRFALSRMGFPINSRR